MARIRTIKPEFFTSEDIVGMTPLARLFYVSLWCESDREGRLEWKPGTFKMRYLPGDNIDVNDLAQELVAKGLIILYSAGGKQYAEIPTFTEHQVVNNRETKSTIPARVDDASGTRESAVKAEGKEGREGKGREGKEGSPAQAPDAPPEPEPELDDSEKPRRRRSTDEDDKTARWMHGMVLSVNASAKLPNWPVWGDEVRLMREIDGRTHKQICELFQWAKRDSFWCANIQSPGKLREKWDVLTEQRMRPASYGRSAAPNEKFNFAHADRSGDIAAMQASMARHGISTEDDGEEIEI